MPRNRRMLGLSKSLPKQTGCKALNRLEIAEWCIILILAATLLPPSGVFRVDASGVEDSHASGQYTKWTELMIQQFRVTLRIDMTMNAILELHLTTIRKHDTQIASSLTDGNTRSMDILPGDKGYNDQKIRRLPRQHKVCPLSTYPKLTSLYRTENGR